jgi:hypothetical protein
MRAAPSLLVSFLLLAGFCGSVRADDLSPLLDDETYGVVRIDLERLDLTRIGPWLVDRYKASGFGNNAARQRAFDNAIDIERLTPVAVALRAQGARRLYMVFSTRQLGQEWPFLFAVNVDPAAGKRIDDQTRLLGLVSTRAGAWLFVGQPEGVKAMAGFKPTDRRDLQHALALAREGTVVAAISIGMLAREQFDALIVPPDEFTNAEIGAVIGGFKSAVAVLNLPPNFAAGLRVETTDDVSADTYASLLKQVRQSLESDASWRGALARTLDVKRKGRVFTVEVDTATLDRVLGGVKAK